MKFELVGVPKCMDEDTRAQSLPQYTDEVMVFDMSKPASRPKPSRPKWP